MKGMINMMMTMHDGPYDYGDHRVYAYAICFFIFLFFYIKAKGPRSNT